MPTTLPTPDLTKILPSADECFTYVKPWLAEADIVPHWPESTANVAAMLTGGGYDIDEATLDLWARHENCGEIRDRGRGFEWKPMHVVAAAKWCEVFRRWRLVPAHAAKMTAMEAAFAESGPSMFGDDLARFTVRDLLVMLETLGNAADRHQFRIGIMAKLRDAGVEL
jgi:hypothetical protein